MSPASFDAAAIAASWGRALRLEGDLPLKPGFHLRRRRAAIEHLYDLLILDSGAVVAALNPAVHAAFESSLAGAEPSLEAFAAWRASFISDRRQTDTILYADRPRFRAVAPLPGTELRILDEADEALFDSFAALVPEEEYEASSFDPSAELVAGLFSAGRLVAVASAAPASEAEARDDGGGEERGEGGEGSPAIGRDAADPRWLLAHLTLAEAKSSGFAPTLLSFLADRALAQGGFPELRLASSGSQASFTLLEAERLGFFVWARREYPEGEE